MGSPGFEPSTRRLFVNRQSWVELIKIREKVIVVPPRCGRSVETLPSMPPLWVTPRDSDPPIKGDSMRLKGLKLLVIRPGHVRINQIRVPLKGPLEGYSPDEILHCQTTAYLHSCSQAFHQPEHSTDEILHCQTRTCTCTCTCTCSN